MEKTSVAAKSLASFIAKFSPSVAKTIRAVRAKLKKRFPTANELVYDNYNFFVIGYSPTERPSDTIVSIAANSKGVGLSFYRGAALSDPKGLLLGNGAQNRFIRLGDPAVLDRPDVMALVDQAASKSVAPLATSGGGKLIIRSISAKQRPRREETKQAMKPKAGRKAASAAKHAAKSKRRKQTK